MKNFLSKNAFWVLQFLGWGIFASINFVSIIKNSSFIIGVLLFCSMFFSGIVASSILRFYLKKSISIIEFRAWDIVKTLIAILVSVFIYVGISALFGLMLGYLSAHFGLEQIQLKNMPKIPAISFLLAMYFILGIWTVIYFGIRIFRKFNNERLARMELKASIKQAQLNTLKGQVNPQFMFTSLNNISGLMLEDVSSSRDMITRLAEMLRYSLTKNNINQVPLEEELEMVDHYIALSKIQYDNRLIFKNDIDTEALKIPVPPMLIQLMIENATKHGIFKMKSGGKIDLTAHVGSDMNLKIIVRHEGQLNDTKELKASIDRIKQRLRLLYNEAAVFWIQVSGNFTEHICKIQIDVETTNTPVLNENSHRDEIYG